ncbi:L,D-transpeptidase family protein [Flavobacterium cerinum]|nr:L,D-transpeptidase family protein [Flavobacterium cerinum]
MIWMLLLLPVGLAVYYFYPGSKIPKGKTVDKLIVYKSKRSMEAWSGSERLKTYHIALGKNPIGHKQFEGDNKTPEGVYHINDRNPKSGYHKNLGVSYPNTADKTSAEKLGKAPGGHIKIHGLRNGTAGYMGKFHRLKDWTAGCIAVTNDEVDELYTAVKENAVIEIYP